MENKKEGIRRRKEEEEHRRQEKEPHKRREQDDEEQGLEVGVLAWDDVVAGAGEEWVGRIL